MPRIRLALVLLSIIVMNRVLTFPVSPDRPEAPKVAVYPIGLIKIVKGMQTVIAFFAGLWKGENDARRNRDLRQRSPHQNS